YSTPVCAKPNRTGRFLPGVSVEGGQQHPAPTRARRLLPQLRGFGQRLRRGRLCLQRWQLRLGHFFVQHHSLHRNQRRRREQLLCNPKSADCLPIHLAARQSYGHPDPDQPGAGKRLLDGNLERRPQILRRDLGRRLSSTQGEASFLLPVDSLSAALASGASLTAEVVYPSTLSLAPAANESCAACEDF